MRAWCGSYSEKLVLMLMCAALNGCGYIRGIDLSKIQSSLTEMIVGSPCDSSSFEGTGISGDPFVICSVEQFAMLEDAVAGTYYIIDRDLDFNGEGKPIPGIFHGELDGQNHVLSNFNYSAPEASVGFFRSVSGGTVKNVVLENFIVGGMNNSGILSGNLLSNSILSNVTIKDSVLSGGVTVGAIGGRIVTTTADHITISNTAVQGYQRVGLFAGWSPNGLILSDSTIQGQVTGSGYLGGYVGLAANVELNRTAFFGQVNLAQDQYLENQATFHIAVGAVFGSVSNSQIYESYFVGSLINSSIFSDEIGMFAGRASNTLTQNFYLALNSYGDVDATISGNDFFIGNDMGGNTFDYQTTYFEHAQVPANNQMNVWGYSKQMMRDQANFGFDFSDFSDPDNIYIGTWQMATAAGFKFPIFSSQSTTLPFGETIFRSEPVGPVWISEVADANGYTFADTNSDSSNYTTVTFHNDTSGVIYLKGTKMGGVRDAFKIASGAPAGTCATLIANGTGLFSGQTCTIGIDFTPYKTSALTEVMRDPLIVNYTIGGTMTRLVHPIDGAANLVGPFIVGSDLAFGNVVANFNPVSQNIYPGNFGPDAATIVSITVSDPVYTLDLSSCTNGLVLNYLGDCILGVTFTPTAHQDYPATITFTYQGTTQKSVTFELTGKGIEHPFNDDPSPACQIADGTVAKPYCVNNRAELEATVNYASSYFIQTADIDMGGISSPMSVQLNLQAGGSYDGQNHNISNIYSQIGGLFVVLNSSTVVKNLILDSPIVSNPTSNFFVGSVVSYNAGGTLDNVSVIGTGSVTYSNIYIFENQKPAGGLVGWNISGAINNCNSSVSVFGNETVGGLVGWLQGGSITNSHSTGSVTGKGRFVGGLVGSSTANAQISNSYSTGLVTALKTHEVGNGFFSSYYVGGFVGYLDGGADVANSYSTGNVMSADGEAGGFAGRIGSSTTVTDSYSTGNVTAAHNSVGGFVGRTVNGSVTNSYSTGNVSGLDHVGGFVGYQEAGSSISRSFTAKPIVTGSGTNVGGFVGTNVGTVSESFTGSDTMSGTNSVGGFVGVNSGTIQHAFTLATSITSGGSSGPFVSSNTGTITNSYFNDDIGVGDTSATGIASADMSISGNFSGFDFGTPIWRMPSTNYTGSLVISPVPSWACGTALGIVCP